MNNQQKEISRNVIADIVPNTDIISTKIIIALRTVIKNYEYRYLSK